MLVCQDAHRLMPWADKLYGCDAKWWNAYNGVPGFAGEKWSTHGLGNSGNDKTEVAEKYGINLVYGTQADHAGFSFDPGLIHYGNNSGFQAINLALLLGATYVVLVGYNMQCVDNRVHFFGDHPKPLFNKRDLEEWVPLLRTAAEQLPDGVTIINATPDSAIDCFPQMSLKAAIENHRLHRHRAVTAA